MPIEYQDYLQAQHQTATVNGSFVFNVFLSAFNTFLIRDGNKFDVLITNNKTSKQL